MLSRFRAEYEASRRAPRPVPKLFNFLEAAYPACHSQAHELGKALFAATGDIEMALRECRTSCTSGCMHGAVSEAFATESPEKIAARMNAFCAAGEMARLHKPGNCAHGLGHGLMFVTRNDVRMSIDACLGFTTEPMQYYCATGVYMEKFMLIGPAE